MSNNRSLAIFSQQEKNRENIGKKINIAGVDKTLIITALYKNLSRDKFVDHYRSMYLLHRFKENNYCLYWFDYQFDVDLSTDEFDPTEYDRINNTYQRDDVRTAAQCVEWVRSEIKKWEEDRIEALRLIKIILERDDYKFNSNDDLYLVNNENNNSNYEYLLSLRKKLNEIGIKASVKDGSYGQFKKPYLELNDYMCDVVEKLRQHLIKQALNENILRP